jgi:hypothetical protein
MAVQHEVMGRRSVDYAGADGASDEGRTTAEEVLGDQSSRHDERTIVREDTRYFQVSHDDQGFVGRDLEMAVEAEGTVTDLKCTLVIGKVLQGRSDVAVAFEVEFPPIPQATELLVQLRMVNLSSQ